MSALQTQVGGDHYKGVKIQHFTFCETNRITWGLACVLKYVIRHEKKNKFQDLEKALHYLLLFMEHVDPETYATYATQGFPIVMVPTSAEVYRRFSAHGAITPEHFCDENDYLGMRRDIIFLVCGADYKHFAKEDGVNAVLFEIHSLLREYMFEYYPSEYAKRYGEQMEIKG